LDELHSSVVASAAAGVRSLTIELDEVGVLDSAVISTLIKILRDVRAHGSAVSLSARRKSLLDTLRVTALDKVFKIVTPGEQAA
jgi:anti-anti-sigma factor